MFDYLSLNLAMAIEMTHIFFLKSGVVPWGCSYYTATENGNPARWHFPAMSGPRFAQRAVGDNNSDFTMVYQTSKYIQFSWVACKPTYQ